MIFAEKNILRLDISMENTISMHVINRLNKLIHIILDSVLRQIMSLSLNCIIHVHIHQLENKRQTSSWLITITRKTYMLINIMNKYTYYSTSYSLMIYGCGLSLLRAWISLRLLTCSMVSKWFFMHLMATYLPVLILCALRTSEKVPSPFLEINLYSIFVENIE